MNILLLGGSNAGLSIGWAEQLRSLATEHGVSNRFLGAVGSLFGLLRIMELGDETAPRPDLIVFEYSLNDMILMFSGALSPELLDDTLQAVANQCGRLRIPLLLLCLQVKRTGGPHVEAAIERVNRAYADLARTRRIDCLTLGEIFGSASDDLYADNSHLTEDASRRVAEVIAERIATGRIAPPTTPTGARDRFRFVPARDAAVTGPHRRIVVEATVFSGPFLEIGRGGTSRWPGRGKLVGLMLRSTETAGFYTIDMGNRAIRKNAQSQMREIVPKLLLLHYLTRPLPVSGSVTIGMPDDEAALMRLPEDLTTLAADPMAAFPEQVLEINGIMLWQRPTFWTRLRDTILRR